MFEAIRKEGVMMDKVILEEIRLSPTELGTRVDYKYKPPEILQKYIKGEPLFVEFPCDMKSVPLSILAIPFAGIMATVTMLLNVEIHVPVLEKSFMDCIEKLSKVYEKMYPDSGLNINVFADNVEKTKMCSEGGTSSALFFTGGVDATSALIGLLDEKPTLVNIWGGDLRLTDEDSHRELEQYLDTITEYLDLDYCFIKTNAREMFCENELEELTIGRVGKALNHGWWATIAHTLSMTSASIPWLLNENISKVYFGSSYQEDKATYDANNIELLHAMASENYKIECADINLERNDKVTKIVRWKQETKTPIQLKVCWRRVAGKNCSSCEKCYRTILNILSNHGDPNEFGFEVDTNVLLGIKKYLETHRVGIAFWKPIQDAFIADKEYWCTRSEISWILDVKFNSIKTLLPRVQRKLIQWLRRR